MNIKPIAKPGNYRYFLWELSDIILPDYLSETLKDSEWVPYNKNNTLLKHSEKRFKVNKFEYGIFDHIFNDLNYSIINSKDYDTHVPWPFDIGKQDLELKWGSSIIKDKSEFNMTPHLDNNLMFATCIINLKDNGENTTEYFKDENGKELIYKSPGKKSTGVLHVNSPHLYHSVSNKSKQDRIILMNNLTIPSIFKYRNEI